MDEQAQVVEVRRRRSGAEATQLVAEYEASGLSLATLARYRKRQAKGSPAAGNRWVEVKESAGRPVLEGPASSGLAVALRSGRRIEVGCGFDAHTLAQLLDVLERIDDLFGIDAQARELNLDHAARHALRLEWAQPLVEIMRGEGEAVRDACLPSSALGKAANYTLSLWRKLTRFLEYPELELSNNLAENSVRLRPILSDVMDLYSSQIPIYH